MNYIVISDIHLGHRKTPSTHIVENLRRAIYTEKNIDLDVIFIAGDLFDRLLDFNSADVRCIVVFFHEFLEFCSANSIKLRILEGTPSHDWRQSRVLVEMNEGLREPCDLEYFDSPDIEVIEPHGVSVLYIPDEWTSSHEVLEECIETLKKTHNCDRIDIGIFHGQFNYQVKGFHVKGVVFDEDYFLKLIRYTIHVGHYHTHNPFDRIVPQGSFDRISHGEEENKGFVRAWVNKETKTGGWEFEVNPNAYPYISLELGPNLTVKGLDKKLSQIPKDAYVRLIMKRDHPLNTDFAYLKSRYLDCVLERKIIKDKEVIQKEESNQSPQAQFLCLTEGNIYALLTDSIKEQNVFGENDWKIYNTIVESTHG